MSDQYEAYDPFAVIHSDAIQQPDALLRYWLGLVRGVASVFTVLTDCLLRWRFGSQVCNPVRALVGWFAVGIATIVGTMMEAGFHSTSGGPKLIGMQEVFIAFTIVLLYHMARIYRLMVNFDRERDSLEDGPPLRVLQWLGNPSWARCRMVYEPLLILVVAFVLHIAGLSEPTVLMYAIFTAQMSALSAIMVWYLSWLEIRENLDRAHRAQLMMEIVKGQRDGRTLSPAITGHIPQGASAMTRLRIARAVTGLGGQPEA